MMEWIDILDAKKPKDRQLCLVTVPNRQNQNRVLLAHYAKDLYKVDDFDFEGKEGVSGFYICDDEWGYMEVEDVIAWAKIEPYKREN